MISYEYNGCTDSGRNVFARKTCVETERNNENMGKMLQTYFYWSLPSEKSINF